MASNAIIDAFANLRRELSLIFASELKAFDVGHKQALILYYLSQEPSATMTEIAAFSRTDPAATTRTVAALEKTGYVKRRADESDNRRTIVALTKSGEKKAIHALEVRKKIAVMVNETLSSKERDNLAELLTKVASGLKKG